MLRFWSKETKNQITLITRDPMLSGHWTHESVGLISPRELRILAAISTLGPL